MTETITEAEDRAVRGAIATAVLEGPKGLADALGRDPYAYLRLVAASRAGSEEATRLLRDAVAGARHAGHSWDVIGRELGVSRQAAQQRFGPVADAPLEDTPERRTLRGLTAMDEMEALEREGKLGWHAVDLGLRHFVVERSGHPWEHRRVVLTGAGKLEAEGWTQVGTWFPWRYFKRPLPQEPRD